MKKAHRVVLAAALALLPVVPVAFAGASSPAASGGARTRAARPPITVWPIPFGPKRKHQMAAYSERHYGERTWRLTNPHVIVEHIAVASSDVSTTDGSPVRSRLYNAAATPNARFIAAV